MFQGSALEAFAGVSILSISYRELLTPPLDSNDIVNAELFGSPRLPKQSEFVSHVSSRQCYEGFCAIAANLQVAFHSSLIAIVVTEPKDKTLYRLLGEIARKSVGANVVCGRFQRWADGGFHASQGLITVAGAPIARCVVLRWLHSIGV
eukprot:6036469-Amphidinium_carterae.2